MQPSRQLFYFLLGLILPFIAFGLSSATECPDTACINSAFGSATFMGWYDTSADAQAAAPGDAYWFQTNLPKICWGDESGGTYAFDSYRSGSSYWVVTRSDLSCTWWNQDTDDDGLPDECDAYPEDSTPYSIKLVSYQTSDNQWESDHVRECYETDRGDYYCIGAAYDNTLVSRYRENSAWIDPSDVCSTGITKSDAEDGEDKFENPAISNQDPTGDAPADTDTTLQSGQKSDGTETGDAALRGIIDNTGDTAGNTKRIGEYMKDLNAAIQNMERNAIIANERAEGEAAEREQDKADAEAGKEALENFDVETALGDHIDPTITEGAEGDYQDHGPLAEETWVTEFINSNPIKTVLDQSGFQYSSASCTANLDLGYLGQHSINLCPLEDGFIAFGNLLVALTTLTGLIHVITGRGF